MLQEHLHHVQVAAVAGQTERRVVIVGRGAVHVREPAEKEGDRAEVAGAGRLHQRRPAPLGCVLLGGGAGRGSEGEDGMQRGRSCVWGVDATLCIAQEWKFQIESDI